VGESRSSENRAALRTACEELAWVLLNGYRQTPLRGSAIGNITHNAAAGLFATCPPSELKTSLAPWGHGRGVPLALAAR